MRIRTCVAAFALCVAPAWLTAQDTRPRVEYAEMAPLVTRAIAIAIDEYESGPKATGARPIVTDVAESMRRLSVETRQTQAGKPGSDPAPDARTQSVHFLDHFSCKDPSSRMYCTITSDAVYVGVMKIDTADDGKLLAVWVDRRWRNQAPARGSTGSVLQLLFRRTDDGALEFVRIGLRVAAQGA